MWHARQFFREPGWTNPPANLRPRSYFLDPLEFTQPLLPGEAAAPLAGAWNWTARNAPLTLSRQMALRAPVIIILTDRTGKEALLQPQPSQEGGTLPGRH